MSVELIELVRMAKMGDNDALTDVLEMVRPILIKVACGLTHHRPIDWIVQDGFVGIWRNIRRVDVERPNTVKHIIVTYAIHAMISSINSMKNINQISDEQFESICTADVPEILELKGLLRDYYKYIIINGSMRGAHEHFANKYKCTKANMVRRFFNAAKSLTDGKA